MISWGAASTATGACVTCDTFRCYFCVLLFVFILCVALIDICCVLSALCVALPGMNFKFERCADSALQRLVCILAALSSLAVMSLCHSVTLSLCVTPVTPPQLPNYPNNTPTYYAVWMSSGTCPTLKRYESWLGL